MPDTSPIRLVLPAEQPPLTPEAARALLRILVKAHARHTKPDHHDNENNHQEQSHDHEKGAAT